MLPNGPLKVQLGDRVAYSAQFLRSTGQVVGSTGRMRGTIVPTPERLSGLDPAQFATVKWDAEDALALVNLCNLAKPGPNRRFANVD